ncbi:MAG: ATP-binding protein, partial [Candidatus Limnocylindria bacterium]
ELAALRAAFRRARAGGAALALIVGPPGQGKTRLVEEFLEPLSAEARILRARCRPGSESGVSTPLRQFLEADALDGTRAALATRLAALGVLAAELERIGAALAHSAGLEVDRRLLSLHPQEREEELALAWRRYAAALGRERPTVLWVEDLHWAEPLVARMLDRVAGADAPVLVVATARPELDTTAVHSGPLRLDLGPLDPPSAVALARSAGAADAGRSGRAEGNPLFIIELARARVEAGDELPLNVHGAIAARLDELAAEERELLQRASVIGETFEAADVALLAERDAGRVGGALDRLIHLRYVAAAERGYRFHHALVRDVAYGRLPIADRMRLHARYARDGADPEDAEALAHHWWEALRPPDAEWVWEGEGGLSEMRREALRAHLAAAERLADRFAHERAIEVCTRALAFADGAGEIAEVEAAVGDAYARNAQGDEAWEHRLRAIAAHRRAGMPASPAFYAAMLEVPTFGWGLFRRLPDERLVLELLDEGLRAARAGHDEVALAALLVQDGRFRRAPAELDEALAVVDAAADRPAHANALQRIGQMRIYRGEVARAAPVYRRVDELIRAGARVDEGDVLAIRVLGVFLEGDLGRADEYATRSAALNATSSAHARHHSLGARGLVLLGRGDW